MVEREVERMREPEPELSHYEHQIQYFEGNIQRHQTGRRVVKFKEIPWEQNKQGRIKFYCSTKPHDLAAPGWIAFQHHINTQSGRHIHQGGTFIYIIDGKGYSVLDGVRYDWKKGDLIVIPIKPGQVEHQHFNEDPNKPVRWVALVYYPWMDATASMLRQVETHPDWGKNK